MKLSFTSNRRGAVSDLLRQVLVGAVISLLGVLPATAADKETQDKALKLSGETGKPVLAVVLSPD